METYCGTYITSDGTKIPYTAEIGLNNLYIVYLGPVKNNIVKASIIAKVDENSPCSWKLKGKYIYFRTPKQLKKLFEAFDSFANATFRYVTKIA